MSGIGERALASPRKGKRVVQCIQDNVQDS